MNELTTLETKRLELDLKKEEFELSQRQGKALSLSAFFPKDLRNDVASAVIIYDLAERMNVSVMEVSQSIYIIHGKPSFSTSFLVARLNQSNLIRGALRTIVSDDKQSAYCVAIDADTGEELVGMTVTMDMAQAEGWLGKAGSKWKTMPELMMRKRCQSFFIKEFYPQVMFGTQSTEEAEDFVEPEKKKYISASLNQEPKEKKRVRRTKAQQEAERKVEEVTEAVIEEEIPI